MKFRNVAELHNKTSEILREIEKDEHVVITSHGKPKAIIQKFSEEDVEDFVIENSPRIRKSIEESYKDYMEHGGFSLEKVERLTFYNTDCNVGRDIRWYSYRKHYSFK